MIRKDTLLHSLYITAGIVTLTLTGIFGIFERRSVIENYLSLSTVVLILMVGGTGYYVAMQVRESGLLPAVVNGLVGSTIVGVALAILVIIEINVNLRFMFQNLTGLNESTLTFDREVSLADGRIGGLLLLLGFSAGFGALSGIIAKIPARARDVLLVSAGLTVIIGLVRGQINNVIALPDAMALTGTLLVTYVVGRFLPPRVPLRSVVGFGIGAAIGILLAVIAGADGLAEGGILRGTGSFPVLLGLATRAIPLILGLSISGSIVFVILLGVVGVVGALTVEGSKPIHNATLYFFVSLLILGILNWQGEMTPLSTAMIYVLLVGVSWFVPVLSERAATTYERIDADERRVIQRIFVLGLAVVMLFAPQFMGLYISNVFNQVALFAIMGMGLNVMIGYAGLLDLGYVASFAIGAYTVGILTTPNLLTCGGVHPNEIPFSELEQACTGTMTFWMAWPICVLVSALTGMMLGVPVLRLRGDYLAIVTLGFGEIIHRIILSNDFKPLLGGAQGISPIPSPTLDLTGVGFEWAVELSRSTDFYYLFLIALVLTAFVVSRLANSRLGRAWRAIRSDEDVAQAMGIHLVGNKLLAFGISSAFAGLGGAAFGSYVQGIFPNSFTLLVSINVLSLIIIGGMGSLSGVVVGALILVGMPELLRELQDYRLLAFGALLVTVMIVKPEGLIPPTPPRLSEMAKRERDLQGGTSHG